MDFANQLLQQSKDLVWAFDSDGVLVYANDSFKRIFFVLTGKELDFQQQEYWEAFGTHTVDQWVEYKHRGLRGESFEIEESLVSRKNGEENYFHIYVYPVRSESGAITHVSFFAREITNHVEFRQQTTQLLAKVRVCFIEGDLAESCVQLCEVIQEFGKYQLVEIWIPNMDQSKLIRMGFSTSSTAFDENNNSKAVFNFGEGYPGIVWEKNQELIWDVPVKDEHFLRKKEAKKAGLTRLKGIPLRYQGEIVGVLLIGVNKQNHTLAEIGGFFDRLEQVVGAEIYRKRLEEDLSRIYKAIPDILCVIDFKGNFLRINPAGSELLGYSKEEILNHNFQTFIHPDDYLMTYEVIKDHFDRGSTSFRLDNRYITKDGHIVWLSWNCNFVVKERILYAAAKDISNERQLSELNQQAINMSKIGSWELNFEDNRVFWSDMVHQIHGTDPKKHIPLLDTSLNFYSEEFRAPISAAIERCISNGEPFDLEAIIRNIQGEERWVRVIGKAEFLGDRCIKVYGSFQDIHVSKSLELQIKEILGSISDAFYAVDDQWNFTYFNAKAEGLLKKSATEVIGKNIWKLFPELKTSVLRDAYERVRTNQESITIEYKFTTDQNWYEINAYPSKGGVSVYFKNINERIQSAENLRNALEERNKILESIGDGFFTVDANWTVTYWNRVAEKLIGKPREEVVGMNFWEVFPAAKDTGFYRNYDLTMPLTEPITVEEFYTPLNLWLEVTIYPAPDGLSLFFKDINLKHQAQKEIKLANDRFEKASEATQDVIWDWDIKNDTMYRSNNIVNFFGKDALTSLPINQYWFHRFHPDDVKTLRKSVFDAINDPNVTRWEMEYRIFNDVNEKLYIMDRGVIMRDEEGKAIRMVGAMSDLTRQKMLEKELLRLNASLNRYAKELERSNEELEQFAFITSHDLQEPLRMISSFMDQLKRKYGDQLDEKALQYIFYASDGAKRMKQIILDLLEYSRAGRQVEKVEPININEILNDFKLLRRKIIAEKGAKLIIPTFPVVVSNKVAITQVLHSLIDNALKYAKPGIPPVIEINVEENEADWVISIKDHGIGIKPEFFNKIFVIFQRLHNRNEYSGTGIGLSIAKRHIESLGGKIWLESEPDQGSTFYFSIPKPTVQ